MAQADRRGARQLHLNWQPRAEQFSDETVIRLATRSILLSQAVSGPDSHFSQSGRLGDSIQK